MAIVRVNSQTGGPSSGATVATSAFSVTGGNFVVVAVSWEGSGTLTSVTDSKGNTYALRTERRQPAADAVQLAHAENVTGDAALVITANFSGTIDFSSIRAIQYSGMATSSAFDVEAGGNGNSAAASSGSVSTNQADALLINAAVNFGGGITFSPTSPWVTEVTESSNCAVDERIVAATSSYSAAQTLSGSSDWAIAFAAFKAAAAASGDTQEWRFYPPQRRSSSPNLTY